VVLAEPDFTPIGYLSDTEAIALQVLLHDPEIELQMQCRIYTNPLIAKFSVVIYGALELFEDVGRLLQTCKLFLQDPIGCDRIVEYRNPHRLFRPDLDPVLTTISTATPSTSSGISSEFHSDPPSTSVYECNTATPATSIEIDTVSDTSSVSDEGSDTSDFSSDSFGTGVMDAEYDGGHNEMSSMELKNMIFAFTRLAKRALLDRLLSQDLVLGHSQPIFRCKPGENHAAGQSSSNNYPIIGADRGSSSSSDPGRKSTEKGIGSSKYPSGSGDDGDGDENGGSKELKSNFLTPSRRQTESRKLACPFYKRDPQRGMKSPSCKGPGWLTMHRLKYFCCHLKSCSTNTNTLQGASVPSSSRADPMFKMSCNF